VRPAFDIRFAPDRHEHDVGFYGALLASFSLVFNLVPVNRSYFGTAQKGNLLERISQHHSHLWVHYGNDFVHHFDDGYPGTESRKKACKFDADDAAADDAELLWNFR
jgi:hypothetical protein